MKLNVIARLLTAGTICCALATSAHADDKMGGKMMDHKMGGKMMDSKMDHKMGGKMMDSKMGGKMGHPKMMPGMTAADKKTYMGMSKSEKSLFDKMMKMHMGKM